MSHGDRVEELPKGSVRDRPQRQFPLRRGSQLRRAPQRYPVPSGSRPYARRATYWGTLSIRFVAKPGDWTMANFVETKVAEISAQAGNHDRVLMGLSGGVDSSVAAALIHRAVGDRLKCVFVDTALLRAGERERMEAVFADQLGIALTVADASELFLERLTGVVDPEQKRRVIGHTFIEVFEQQARALGGARFLGQGTLYPDVIESVSFKGPSATIKSHHNVGGLPESMRFELIEPLRELFKDEVRELGRQLGLPSDIVDREPFPGPGLAIRDRGRGHA